MKYAQPLAMLCGLALPGLAAAQASVTIYGLADIGYTHQSNVAGGSVNVVSSGVMRASRLGFRGKEDLGGGNAAIFTLEMGLNIDDGSVALGGLAFGRQSFVGLEGAWGSLTLGRQYTYSTDFLVTLTAANYNGQYAFHPGDIDKTAGAERANGAIKYTSANVNGLRFGAMYGPGDAGATPGAPRVGRLSSAGISYANGPLTLAAAVTQKFAFPLNLGTSLGVNSLFGTTVGATNPVTGAITTASTTVSRLRTVGAGASYAFDGWTMKGLATSTQIQALGRSGTYTALEVSPEFRITPLTVASVGYARLGFQSDRWNELSAGLDYALSKRTDVYMVAVNLRGSPNTRAAIVGAVGSSNSPNQTVVRVGIRHAF